MSFFGAFVGAAVSIPLIMIVLTLIDEIKEKMHNRAYHYGYEDAIIDLEKRNQYWSNTEQVWIDAKFKKNKNDKIV